MLAIFYFLTCMRRELALSDNRTVHLLMNRRKSEVVESLREEIGARASFCDASSLWPSRSFPMPMEHSIVLAVHMT